MHNEKDTAMLNKKDTDKTNNNMFTVKLEDSDNGNKHNKTKKDANNNILFDNLVEETDWTWYIDPARDRKWYFKEATKEMFFVDDEGTDWMPFNQDGKTGWWHLITGRYFLEPE